MTCFRCCMPIPMSRYGITETLCPECLDEVREEDRERVMQMREASSVWAESVEEE